MNRRDFLLFRTEKRLLIAELSCERLYMRYLDAQALSGDAREKVNDEVDDDSWQGEPPARLEVPTTRQLFDDLDLELQTADVVRVAGSEWLASEEFRREVELLMSAVRARGGRVEYQR